MHPHFEPCALNPTCGSLPLLAGFWRVDPYSTKFIRCETANCIGGIYPTGAAFQGLLSNATCRPGSYGALCSLCSDGHALESTTGSCVNCDNWSPSAATLAPLIILIVLIGLAVCTPLAQWLFHRTGEMECECMPFRPGRLHDDAELSRCHSHR